MGQLKGHLHYGGHLSGKTGKLGKRPQQGTTFRSQKRYETIIRLENAAFPHAAIAAMLCISPTRLAQIKAEPGYLAARVKLTHGIILDNEAQVANIRSQRREILTNLLPPALQVIADEIQRPAVTFAERKHKVALAQDLLDREGLFAKISKTEIKPVDSFDFERADSESMAVIQALTSAAKPVSTDASRRQIEETIRTNTEFSNSHTLSSVDQQQALDTLENEALLRELPTDGKIN